MLRGFFIGYNRLEQLFKQAPQSSSVTNGVKIFWERSALLPKSPIALVSLMKLIPAESSSSNRYWGCRVASGAGVVANTGTEGGVVAGGISVSVHHDQHRIFHLYIIKFNRFGKAFVISASQLLFKDRRVAAG